LGEPPVDGRFRGEEDDQMKMKTFACTLLWCAAMLGGQTALAQAFPTRPVTIVVPYPPGGLIDIVARQIQPRLQTELGQSVIIENRAGAGGNVGAEAVARATPDGHTLLLANPSLAISPLIYPKLNYRPEDFAHIGQYGTVPNVLVVNPLVPAKNVAEFIEYVKKNPGKLNYASPGYGTSPQMSSELFKAMTGTFVVHIPFRGSGPAQAAMLANETQMMFDNLPPQLAHIRSGKVRALAVTSLTRSNVLPDLPTLDEAGLKGYEVTAWFGLVAPPATPRPVVMRLNEALNKTTQDPKVRESLVASGATVIQGTPEQFRDFIKGEMVKWAPIVKRANIVPD
jgi:tripartite-type tricarboxylate transporter receptor subunit TctC